MKSSWNEPIWTFLRILVGFVFAYAGFSKLIEPAGNFEGALLKYGVFPSAWIPVMARIVPWLEWILGSLLLVGYATRFVAPGVGLLCVGFLVTLGSSRLFLESGGSDCGCFGGGWVHFTIRQIFFVDVFFLPLTIRLAGSKRLPWSIDSFLLQEKQHP